MPGLFHDEYSTSNTPLYPLHPFLHRVPVQRLIKLTRWILCRGVKRRENWCPIFSHHRFTSYVVSLAAVDWYFVCCVFCVVLFFCVMVQSSMLLYSSVLLHSSLLFILLCSSSCYLCVFDCIYCTLTLPLGVNPIAVNKHLSIIRSKNNLRVTICSETE
jgi:hypothetical protein